MVAIVFCFDENHGKDNNHQYLNYGAMKVICITSILIGKLRTRRTAAKASHDFFQCYVQWTS